MIPFSANCITRFRLIGETADSVDNQLREFYELNIGGTAVDFEKRCVMISNDDMNLEDYRKFADKYFRGYVLYGVECYKGENDEGYALQILATDKFARYLSHPVAMEFGSDFIDIVWDINDNMHLYGVKINDDGTEGIFDIEEENI